MMLDSFIGEIVKKTIKMCLMESKVNFNNLYDADGGDNITEYVLNYLSWSERGNFDSEYSILASQLHQALMYTLSLTHENQKDRQTFSNILRYLRILNKHVGIKSVEIFDYSSWRVFFDKTYNFSIDDNVIIEGNDFEDYNNINYIWEKAIVFKTSDGINHDKCDYRPGSDNGSSGYYTTIASMTDEMKQEIYSMGLVPAIFVSGSYHENFIYSVGVLPEMVSALKRMGDDGIYFDCKFVDSRA